jgi:ABC-type nitrate/sulfonate/bicarbonate transport system permease component
VTARPLVMESSPPRTAPAPSPQQVQERVRRGAGVRDWMLDQQWPVALAFTVVVALVWEATARGGQLPAYILAPTQTVAEAWGMLRSGELLPLIQVSMKREFSGFVIGAGLGVVAGLVAGVAKWTGDVIDGAVSLLYPVPKIAMLPIFAIWLGFTDTTRIAVIALACFFPAYLNAQSATRSVDPNLVAVARNVESGRLRTIFQVLLPAALPRILVGVRTALALSFIMMFATEVIGAGAGRQAGLGGRTFAAGTNGDYAVLWAVLLTIAVLGVTLDTVLRVVSARATRGTAKELASHG